MTAEPCSAARIFRRFSSRWCDENAKRRACAGGRATSYRFGSDRRGLLDADFFTCTARGGCVSLRPECGRAPCAATRHAFPETDTRPRAQILYPPSWRERFFGYIRDLGPLQTGIEIEGHVSFTSQFFSPVGVFHGRFNVASGPASVEIHCLHTGVRWEIDGLTLSWTPPPTPTPTPIPTATPTVTPSPSPTPRKPRKRK